MGDAKLYTYASTVLDFKEPADAVVDLRQPLGQRERGILTQLGLSGPFAVLTAYNPEGQNEHPGNQERQEALRRTLEEEAERIVLVDGCSPDRAHREPSIAAMIPEQRAHEIALQYQQDAFFWFDGHTFYLAGAGGPLGRVRLPLTQQPTEIPSRMDLKSECAKGNGSAEVSPTRVTCRG